MKTRQLFLVVFTIIQLIVIVFVFLYLGGYRKFGSPAEFKKRQQENIQAYLDSVASIEKNRLLPENVADFTLRCGETYRRVRTYAGYRTAA